jgi:hypothetical protein
MPNLSEYFYNYSKTVKTNHYIETGTYQGDGVKTILNNYNNIHSIELAEQWYNYNVEQFKNDKNVKLYLGDSKNVLKELLKNINEPVTVYLDAHYAGGSTAYGDEETPLLQELELLKNRIYDDIIIIDDCRLLGKTGLCGCGENHHIYPTMTYDWRDITEEKIKNLMKDDYSLLVNNNHIFTDGACDQFILVKNKGLNTEEK